MFASSSESHLSPSGIELVFPTAGSMIASKQRVGREPQMPGKFLWRTYATLEFSDSCHSVLTTNCNKRQLLNPLR